jgi:prohibitin 2
MGISSLLGTLSLLGFVAFLAGVGLVVVAAAQGRPVRGGVLLAVVGLIGGIVFTIIGQGVLFVEPTQVAVVVNTLSGAVEEPRRGGTHIVFPGVQSVATYYPITQQEYTMSATGSEGALQGDDAVEARTSDGQQVSLDVTVLFRVVPDQADDLYITWSQNYINGFVRTTTRSIVREVVSNYSAEDIYGEARTQLADDIRDVLRESFQSQYLELTDLLVRDINFSESFTQSIEEKVVAEQQALQAEIRVRQEQQEAERVRTRAAGARDAAIAQAEGEAQSIILRAQAEAEALRLVSEQIAANPSLIQYLYVQNLSDNVNIALVPSNSPFLFDFQSLAEGNANFSAPAAAPQTSPTQSPTAEPEVTPTPAN